MRTITSEAQRFPNPKSFLPVLVVKNWVEKRIVELENEPETAASKTTLEKLRGIDIQSALIEPPILIDADKVKVCILSRKVGTLWLDEPVMKITFDEFLALAFPETVPNSVLYRAEPYTLEELEGIIDSERSAPVPGYIDVIDETGKTIKVIIGDVLDENTVHREALFGEFKFEKATTNVYGYDGDAYPAYPFATLNDFSLAITTIEDVFLKENVVIHSVPLNLLRALKQENNKPPKITSVALAGASTVVEQAAPADYDITNGLNITFDKAPKPSDLVVVSLKDDNGTVLPAESYSTRVLATADPKVMNLEINLLDYQRKFFAPDSVGKKFSFSVVVKSAGVVKETTQALPVIWQNVGNTHTANVVGDYTGFSDVNNFPLGISLVARAVNQAVTVLDPLVMPANPQDIFLNSSYAPVMKDGNFTLTVVDGLNLINFNTKLNEFGPVTLNFADTRIVAQTFFIVDPAETYTVRVEDAVYEESAKEVKLSCFLVSPYSNSIATMGTVVEEFKNLELSANGVAGETHVQPNEHMGAVQFTLTMPYEGNTTNLAYKAVGTLIVGRNKHEVPFSLEGILNQVDLDYTAGGFVGITTASKATEGWAVGNGLTLTTSLPVEVSKLKLTALKDALGNDILAKATFTPSAVDETNFKGLILLAPDYSFPVTFAPSEEAEGALEATFGIEGSETAETVISIPYRVTRPANSMRAWVTAITTSTQTATAKDSAIMEVAFLDENNKPVTLGIDSNPPVNETLFSGNQLTYLGGGITFTKNSDDRLVARIPTKFTNYGEFTLTFANTAFKGDPSSIVDPSSVYALNPISAAINKATKQLGVTHALQKDGADFSTRISSWDQGEPKATINGEVTSPDGFGWNYAVTPALSTIFYNVGDVTVVPYAVAGSTLYIGGNRVPVPFATSGTGYIQGGGPANTSPGMVDGSGNPIVDGGTTADNKPVLSGSDMKPGSKVTITDNGGTPVEVTVGDDGEWTYTPDPALANGEHVFNIKGTDKNEMAIDKTITINVNASSGGGETDPVDTKPGMTDKDGNPIEDGGTTTDNKPTFSGSDMKPGSTVTIKDGDVELGTAIVGEDGTWTYQPDPALGNGSHEIGIVGTDKNDAPVDEKTTVVVDAPEEGGGTDPGQTDEEKALADPSEGGKYSAPGQAGFGSTMETYPDVTEVKPPYNLTATPIIMVLPYVDKGSID